MSSFTDPLITEYIGNGKRKVTRGFRYYIGEENSKEHVDVPVGFATDFASVPFPFRMLIPKDGDYNQASVLHDYLYVVQIFSRKKSDDIFLEAMTVLDKSEKFRIPLWKRQIMYQAVRLGGWRGWNRNAKKIEEMDRFGNT